MMHSDPRYMYLCNSKEGLRLQVTHLRRLRYWLKRLDEPDAPIWPHALGIVAGLAGIAGLVAWHGNPRWDSAWLPVGLALFAWPGLVMLALIPSLSKPSNQGFWDWYRFVVLQAGLWGFVLLFIWAAWRFGSWLSS